MSEIHVPAPTLNLLRSVLNTNVSECSVNLLLGSIVKLRTGPQLRAAQLLIQKSAEREIRRIVSDYLAANQEKFGNEEITVLPYLPGHGGDNEMAYVDLDKVPFIKEQIRIFQSTDQWAPFDNDDAFVAGIRFSVIVLRHRSTPVYFFRVHTSSNELSRSLLLTALNEVGSFDQIKRRTFVFDGKVDCFCVGDHLFVSNVSKFQVIFRYLEKIREEGVAAVDTISQYIPMVNSDILRIAAHSTFTAVKLRNIVSRGHMQKIPMTSFKRYADLHSKRFPTQIVRGVESLILSKDDLKDILYVLNETAVTSTLSQAVFEAPNKRLKS